MAEAPNTIWLHQEEDGPWANAVWCEDSVGDGDVAYVRADRLPDGAVRMRTALKRIVKWFGEFPAITDRNGKPTTYGAAYGSNGERDYMRAIAHAALSTTPAETREGE